jgi:glycosyltransferase involved in cell wall biosynthesis
VADSNSNDGTAEYLAEVAREHPRVRHLPGPYTGRAMARNAGIEAARGAIVMFTDADIIASSDLVSRHLAHHAPRADRRRRHGTASQLRTKTTSVSTRIPSSAGRFIPNSRKRLVVAVLLTGNASVRKSDLDRVGRFDEDSPATVTRISSSATGCSAPALTIVYDPHAIDYHWHPVPYAEQKEKMKLAGRRRCASSASIPTFGVRARSG